MTHLSAQKLILQKRRVRLEADPFAYVLRGLFEVIEQELQSLPENVRPKEIQIDLAPQGAPQDPNS